MPSPIPNKSSKDPLIYHQQSFSGGMNMQVDPTRLESNEYPLLINGRTRYGNIETVKLPTNADPQGSLAGLRLQGIYASGSYIVAFANGRAYYRDVMLSEVFNPVIGFQMDQECNTIWAELVPSSSMNFKRFTQTDSAITNVNLTGSIAGSPQCLVCQDNINQPQLIFADGTTRVANDYNQWTIENREYIPIGSQMMYLNGILYVVLDVMLGSLPLRRKVIARSVTGRPLDFMVNIAFPDGGPGGEAITVSFAVDYDEITNIQKLNAVNGAFLVSTAKNSYLVTPDIVNTIFAEPTFTTQFLFSTGPQNNFSTTDLLGDTALIDLGGIRSFNAVLQNRNEGRNLPFYKKIALLFADVIQPSTTCATNFDDYGLFAVTTIYGPAILVFDTITQTWVGMDIYTNLNADETIIQFCETKVIGSRMLFFRTSANKIYEAFGGTEVANLKVFLGEWCSNDPKLEQKLSSVRLIFTDVESEGTVNITPYVDKKVQSAITKIIQQNSAPFVPPIALPFGSSNTDGVRVISCSIDNESQQGWKFGLWIEWNFAAALSHIRCEALPIPLNVTSDEEQAITFNS